MDYIFSDIQNHFNFSYMVSSGYIAILTMAIFFLVLILLMPGRKLHDRILVALFFGFMFIVYSLTILMRGYRSEGRGIMTQPFYWLIILRRTGRAQLLWLAIENVIMLMVPAFILGIIMRPVKIPARIVMITLIMAFFSLTIECMQFALNVGECEIDDFLCNTFGGLLGAALASLVTAKIVGRKNSVVDDSKGDF